LKQGAFFGGNVACLKQTDGHMNWCHSRVHPFCIHCRVTYECTA